MKKIFFLIIIFLFLTSFVKAQTIEQPNVVINEISWMGTTVSANDEWIELKNNTNQNINLDGWTLRAADGVPEIKLIGIISANSFYLIERTNDDTVLNVTSDLIYKGALGNNGEDLWLYDGNNNLIDEVNGTEKWFAGDNITKQTMEKSSTGWQTSQNVGGTPKFQNSIGAIKKVLAPGLKNDLPKIEKSDSSNEVDMSLAAISQTEKNINPWFLFIVALFITILSAIIILFIKFKLNVRT